LAKNKIEIVVEGKDGLTKPIGKARKSLLGLGNAAKSVGATAGKALVGLGVVGGAAVVGLGVAALKMAGNFEAGMREVNSMMGLTAEEFQKFSKDALKLSSDVGVSADKISKGLYQAISAGIPKENVFEFMEIASKASIAGVTDVETAVDGLTTVINAFKLPMSDTQKVADVLFTTVKGGKTTFAELSRSMFNVAPIAANLGISIEEVAAALATATKQGVPTSVATTQLRQAMTELLKPGKDLAEVIASAGYETGQTMLKELGLHKTLQKLETQAGKSGQSIAEVFGSVEAGGAAMALTGKNVDMAMADLAASMDSAGAATGAYDEINKGLNRQLEIVKTKLMNMGIAIGTRLLPVITPLISSLADKLGPAMDTIGTTAQRIFDGPVKKAFTGVKKVAEPIIDTVREKFDEWKPALKKIAPSLLGIIPGFGLIKTAAAIIPKMADWFTTKALPAIKDFAKTISDTLGPPLEDLIGWVMDDLLPAFTKLKDWIIDKVVAALQTLGDFVIDTILPALGNLASHIAPIITKFTELAKAFDIEAKVDALTGWLDGLFDSFSIGNEAGDKMGDILSTIGEMAGRLGTILSEELGPFVEDMIDRFKEFGEKIAPLVGPAFENVKDIIMTVITTVASFIEEHWDIIEGIFRGALNVIQGIIKVAWSIIEGIIITALALLAGDWDAAWEGLKNMVSGVWDGIQQTIGGALDIIKAQLSLAWQIIKDVARIWWESFATMLSGVWDGVKTKTEEVVDSIRTFLSEAWDTIKETATNVWEGISEVVLGVWDGIKTGIKNAINGIIGLFNDFVGRINAIIRSLNEVTAKIGGLIPALTEIPTITPLAKGGRLVRGGAALVGEEGPEVVHLPTNAVVSPHGAVGPVDYGRLAAALAAQPIMLAIDGQEIAYVIRNRLMEINQRNGERLWL